MQHHSISKNSVTWKARCADHKRWSFEGPPGTAPAAEETASAVMKVEGHRAAFGRFLVKLLCTAPSPFASPTDVVELLDERLLKPFDYESPDLRTI